MLIVSGFRDYYDTAATFGIDKTVVYRRSKSEPEELSLRGLMQSDAFSFKTKEHGNAHYTLSFFLVGFCGHMHPGARLSGRTYGHTRPLPTKHFYSAEALIAELGGMGMAVDRKSRVSPNNLWSRALGWRKGRPVQARSIEHHFAQRTWPTLDRLFHERKAPVFHVDMGNHGRMQVTVNPKLKDLSFQKVKDAHTAFQEIYLFISGVLGVEHRPTLEVSDEVKAAAKGHDGEYSFRKPPGKRGKSRWR